MNGSFEIRSIEQINWFYWHKFNEFQSKHNLRQPWKSTLNHVKIIWTAHSTAHCCHFDFIESHTNRTRFTFNSNQIVWPEIAITVIWHLTVVYDCFIMTFADVFFSISDANDGQSLQNGEVNYSNTLNCNQKWKVCACVIGMNGMRENENKWFSVITHCKQLLYFETSSSSPRCPQPLIHVCAFD